MVHCKVPKLFGFTLAEMLIALTILAEIVTFTIPKILMSQQNAAYNAEAREFMGVVSTAYQLYSAKNGAPPSNFAASDLAPYLNFVGSVTTPVDDMYENTTLPCSETTCFRLHNGAVVRLSSCYFGGTSTTNSIWMLFDPDGMVTDGTTNGPGKSLFIILYYNGQTTTYANKKVTAGNICGVYSSIHPDPPWFHWN